MHGNSILNKARYSSNTDEWYTPYETIAEELEYYKNEFCDQTVLCNCDNPYESNFAYYFLRNFNKLGLKKLICTSYSNKNIDVVFNDNFHSTIWNDPDSMIDDKRGYILEVDSIPGCCEDEVSDDVIRDILSDQSFVGRLVGDGDFRSEECLAYLKECDVCCTNPPFSLFADLFSLLVNNEKKYLIIGNQNALTYKKVFPYIKENKAWVGHRFGDMAFKVPDDTSPRKTRFWIDEWGQKWRSLGNAMWLTNLEISKKQVDLELRETYCPERYPKYDNYDAIHVTRVIDIPVDYAGIMGVPITFLKYYNSSQFEIIGEANHGSDNEFDLFKPIVNGKEVFKRILIKKKR